MRGRRGTKRGGARRGGVGGGRSRGGGRTRGSRGRGIVRAYSQRVRVPAARAVIGMIPPETPEEVDTLMATNAPLPGEAALLDSLLGTRDLQAWTQGSPDPASPMSVEDPAPGEPNPVPVEVASLQEPLPAQ